MEDYVKMYKSICRVCLKYGKSENMVSLLENTRENGLSCYGKSVSTFADVLIKTDDGLPSVMCENCLHLLKQAIRFKFMCEWTQKRLENISRTALASKQNFMDKVVEYSLFTLYFPELCSQRSSTKPTNDKSEEKQMSVEEKHQKNCNEESAAGSSDNDNDYTDEIPLKYLSNKSDQSDDILDKLEIIINTDSKMLDINYKEITIRKKRILKYRTKIKAERFKIIPKQTKEKNLICKVCDKVLANQSTYDYHMQRHNGCRFICEHCAKGFPVLSELQIHLVVRHGIGPYLQCSQCSFKAPRKFDLIEHERLHTGERPYTCEKCGLTFRRRGIWKKHLVHHNEKSIQCPLCPRKFHQRSDMLAHKNNIHERLYVYLCNKCGATYAKTDTVRRHLMERHGIPKELQGKITRINKGREAGFPES